MLQLLLIMSCIGKRFYTSFLSFLSFTNRKKGTSLQRWRYFLSLRGQRNSIYYRAQFYGLIPGANSRDKPSRVQCENSVAFYGHCFKMEMGGGQS